MRETLEKSKEWLECKRFELLHLWVKSIQYKEMTRIMDLIDELQKTPARVETLVEGKFFLTAVKTISNALRTLNSPNLVDVGALEGIKSRLFGMKRVWIASLYLTVTLIKYFS